MTILKRIEMYFRDRRQEKRHREITLVLLAALTPAIEHDQDPHKVLTIQRMRDLSMTAIEMANEYIGMEYDD